MKITGLRHYGTPPLDPIIERDGCTRHLSPRQKLGQAFLRTRPTSQTAIRPTRLADRQILDVNTPGPKHQPKRQLLQTHAMACEPAQLTGLNHGKAITPPGRSATKPIIKSAQTLGDTGQSTRMSLLRRVPVVGKAIFAARRPRERSVRARVKIIDVGGWGEPEVRLIQCSVVEPLRRSALTSLIDRIKHRET